MLTTHEGKLVFSVEKTRFATGLDLIKCLKQILLLTYAPIFELPSKISTIRKDEPETKDLKQAGCPIIVFVALKNINNSSY